MITLAKHIIVAGAENRPLMLEKSMYDSWVSRIRLFIKGKKHGRMMLDSIDNGPLVYPIVEENGQTRPKKYSELTEPQQLQDDYDVQVTIIILHGLPPDVYALVNHQEVAKDIWDRIKMLMKGTKLSYQERECRLMTMQQVQVNTKFLNALPSEWSKFVTNVKLAKSLYTTNYDQFYAGTGNRGIATTSKENVSVGPPRVVKCYNIDTLKETLSNNVKEKESLSKKLTVFKTESKEKESKYIDKEIILEKQNKELENIICKMYRSTQAMHMLYELQIFYDDTHKQALGYQNPFHLKKAQRIQPTLYDGSVIAKEHAMISVNDDEETLILEEDSRSKMLDKQNDPISIEKKIKISPIDYSKLNKIKEDFGKCFVTQKELSAE
ncbi:hypothetical protein Tco_0942035 [Tanacetum coccineum]|uniref:Uncharacterized protein n=1 Tax=Tanacetum coccineum TaxID=301880 RepID=A0ABQ5DSJ5_9ASTR